jgi:hypothetical protein
MIFFVLADAGSPRDVVGPLWAALALAGLFGAGLGAGAVLAARGEPRVPRACAAAGVALLLGLVLAGLPLQGGLSRPGSSWGRDVPGEAPGQALRQRAARLFLEISPLVVVLECAGEDVAHSHPLLYSASGVEWFHRRPYRGRLAGPVLLVVGFAAGEILGRRARRRSPSPAL